MATVLVAANATQQALAESALREAEIAYVTRNDAIQHMLGAGQIGGTNLVTGPPAIQVAASDADAAREVLRELADAPSAAPESPATDHPEEFYSLQEQTAIRHARYSAVWSVLYLWGFGSALAVYFGFRAMRSFQPLPAGSKVLAIAGLLLGTLGIVAALGLHFT